MSLPVFYKLNPTVQVDQVCLVKPEGRVITSGLIEHDQRANSMPVISSTDARMVTAMRCKTSWAQQANHVVLRPRTYAGLQLRKGHTKLRRKEIFFPVHSATSLLAAAQTESTAALLRTVLFHGIVTHTTIGAYLHIFKRLPAGSVAFTSLSR